MSNDEFADLFNQRALIVQSLNSKIFSQMHTLLSCTKELLESIPDEQYHDGKFEWEEAAMLGENVGVAGTWTYNVGAKIMIAGDSELTITPELVNTFKRTITLNVPIVIAISTDRSVIEAFLHDLYTKELERLEQEHAENPDVEELLHAISESISEDDEYEELIEDGNTAYKLENPVYHDVQFDTSTLTDQQKAALRRFSQTTKGKTH